MEMETPCPGGRVGWHSAVALFGQKLNLRHFRNFPSTSGWALPPSVLSLTQTVSPTHLPLPGSGGESLSGALSHGFRQFAWSHKLLFKELKKC